MPPQEKYLGFLEAPEDLPSLVLLELQDFLVHLEDPANQRNLGNLEDQVLQDYQDYLVVPIRPANPQHPHNRLTQLLQLKKTGLILIP
jgi:hypothetical protein